jgi:tetratricopeptide (TPR) repeat protein
MRARVLAQPEPTLSPEWSKLPKRQLSLVVAPFGQISEPSAPWVPVRARVEPGPGAPDPIETLRAALCALVGEPVGEGEEPARDNPQGHATPSASPIAVAARGHDGWASLAAACEAAVDVGIPVVLLLEGAHRAEPDLLDALERLAAAPGSWPVPLVIGAHPRTAVADAFRERIVESQPEDAWIWLAAEPQWAELGRIRGDRLRALQALALLGDGGNVNMLARLLDWPKSRVLLALQGAWEAGESLEDLGQGRFWLPPDRAGFYRAMLLPSLAERWATRLARLLLLPTDPKTPTQPTAETPSPISPPENTVPLMDRSETTTPTPEPAVVSPPKPDPEDAQAWESAEPAMEADMGVVAPAEVWLDGAALLGAPRLPAVVPESPPSSPRISAPPAAPPPPTAATPIATPPQPSGAAATPPLSANKGQPPAPNPEATAPSARALLQAGSQLAAAGDVGGAVQRLLEAAETALLTGELPLGHAAEEAARSLIFRMSPRADRSLAALRASLVQLELGVAQPGEDGLEHLMFAAENWRQRAGTQVPTTWTARALAVEARAACERGDAPNLERALRTLDEAIRLLSTHGEARAAARLLNEQAEVWLRLGDPLRASHLLDRSLEVFLGNAGSPADRREIAQTLHLKGRLPLHVRARPGMEQAAAERALQHLSQAAAVYRDLGDRYGEDAVLESAARIQLLSGNPQGAETTLSPVVRRQLQRGDLLGLARSTGALAEVRAALGDADAALAVLVDSVQLNRRLGSPGGLALNARSLADLRKLAGLDPELTRTIEALLAELASSGVPIGRLA